MERIGKYQITGELGSGGFGRVYRALDPTVGRVVAIKVLNVQDDPALVRRFHTEAATAANLRHQNIVTVHEFSEEQGKQYLVMEFLDGRNLHDLIEEREPIPPLDTVTASYTDVSGVTTPLPLSVPGGSDFALNTGGGISFYLGQRLGFRVEAKAYKPTGDFSDVFGKVEGGFFFQLR
jgi:hypothetical protein